uniref:Uncharacterized protein n=1 Tax=Anguilla anguilla TaxID=7936 RepID=A0A0E9UU06_ANGAN
MGQSHLNSGNAPKSYN